MDAEIRDVMIHLVGNKSQDQELFLSERPANLDEEVRLKLGPYFLNRFGHTFEHFRFSDQPQNSVVADEAKGLFEDPASLPERSKRLAAHLYACSTHPRIKAGELYVTMLDGYPFEGEAVRAIGIFKTELKNGYFEVKRSAASVAMAYREGIDINKFDKGCLILEHPTEDELVVMIIDQQSRGDEAIYWREHFLGLQQRKTNFSMTNLALQSTREFVSDYLDQELDISKTEKIDLMNRSVSYFKENESFDKRSFEETVLEDPEIISSYRRYRQDRLQRSEPLPDESFGISMPAVKQQAKVFKSVLKLDRNFHIYIHGNRNLIERGVDEAGRKFYKIYYESES